MTDLWRSLTPIERVVYTIYAVVLAAFLLGFGSWLMFASYLPILYP